MLKSTSVSQSVSQSIYRRMQESASDLKGIDGWNAVVGGQSVSGSYQLRRETNVTTPSVLIAALYYNYLY